MAIAHRDVAGLLKRHGYTEVRKIGEGSFGKAVLVQNEDGAKLVCKMVDVSQASQKETQDAVKEGRLLAAFRHPYVVRYRESFIESGWLCILMDFCEGGDLTKQIETARKRGQRIPEEQILRWMTQALLALKYIHDKHVLHRDLKSSNFFLSKSGNLKMGDFGIAKVLSCTAACAKTQIGTPYYLSPEVCQEKPYTWPSDIWAMGCILYELCALKVPFDAPNISGLVQKICRGPTPCVPSGYSDFLRNLCTEMLNRNPSSRPSAEAILQRPQIQAIVKLMLEQAQAAHHEGHTGTSSEGMDSSRPDGSSCPPSAPPLHGGGGAGAPCLGVPSPGLGGAAFAFPGAGGFGGGMGADGAAIAGVYRKGDLVEYHSSTHKDWLPATVINADAEGRVVIDLKPNTWISREVQAMSLRPRRAVAVPSVMGSFNRSPSQPQAQAAACPTPMRQRSPSLGGLAGPRAATPGRAVYEPLPGPVGGPCVGRAGSRCATPSKVQRSSREPSPGSRAGTPSRASTPSRAASPRGVRGPPGMPRGPSGYSPNGLVGGLARPCRVAGVAGMAIAGGAM